MAVLLTLIHRNMTAYKVSVIVPIYRVQMFIERCAKSLLSQTLKEIEFIFVNDASPDNSMKILRNVISRYPKRNIIILEHEHNKGLPAARNTGLSIASGEYIFHCDSDDFVEPDMLLTMYEKAKQTDADIVWSDWYLTFKQNERYMKEPSYATPYEALRGILSGTMKFNVWNKLVKHRLYTDNKIYFPSGHAMGEDMTMICLIGCAKSVSYIPRAFYHYVRINTNAYTQTVNSKALQDIRYNVNKVLTFLKDKTCPIKSEEINFFKLNVKLPFLISDDKIQYKLWEEWYPEANKYIMLNNELPFRTRLLQWMAWHKQFWFAHLYYKLFIKLRYGIIYK